MGRPGIMGLLCGWPWLDAKGTFYKTFIADYGDGIQRGNINQALGFKNTLYGGFKGKGMQFLLFKCPGQGKGTGDMYGCKFFDPEFIIGRNHDKIFPDTSVVLHKGIIAHIVCDPRFCLGIIDPGYTAQSQSGNTANQTDQHVSGLSGKKNSMSGHDAGSWDYQKQLFLQGKHP